MGCRIQIKAFERQDGKAEIYIGFEGDETETSILVMREGDKNSLLHTFKGSQFLQYDKTWQYYIRSNTESGNRECIVESFETCGNEFLNKLGSRIKVGDYYYNDEELATLIHGLRVVQPYLRNGPKNYYIRHLQWHNISQVSPEPVKEAIQQMATKLPEYETWGTW